MVAFMHTGTRLTAGYRYTTLGDATGRAFIDRLDGFGFNNSDVTVFCGTGDSSS